MRSEEGDAKVLKKEPNQKTVHDLDEPHNSAERGGKKRESFVAFRFQRHSKANKTKMTLKLIRPSLPNSSQSQLTSLFGPARSLSLTASNDR